MAALCAQLRIAASPSAALPVAPPVTPLHVGQAAPFEGMLFPPASALRLAQRADGCDERLRVINERTLSMMALKDDEAKQLRLALNKSENESLKCDGVLQKVQLREAALARRPSAWVWMGVGILLGAGSTLSVLAAARLSH